MPYVALQAVAQKENIEIIGKIDHAFFEQTKYLPRNHSLAIRFRLSPSAFCLLAPTLDGTAAFTDRLVLKSCYLSIKRVIAHSKVDMQYDAALSRNAMMSFPFNEYQACSFVIPAGQMTFTSEVLLTSLPNLAVFGLVTAKAYYGAYNLSPYMFKPHGLSGYRFLLSGEDVWYNSPKFSVSGDNYVRHYKQLLSIEDANGQLACDVTKDMFTKFGYCLVNVYNSFSGKRDRLGVGRPGNCRLVLNFKENTDENLVCILYYESSKLVQFDKSNVYVKTDFNVDSSV